MLACPLSVAARAQDSIPAQDSVTPLRIATEPPVLTEGSLGWLTIQPIADASITGGEAGGEPIHFERRPDSSFRALVGVPVETVDSFRVTLFLQRGEEPDTVVAALPVRRGGYPNEVLAVPPAFVRPDSAAAARIQSEIAQSRELSRLSLERPRLWRGPFRLPRTSRITSPFGSARVFNGEVQSRHLGTDFAGTIGAPVRAAGRGVVALVADFYLAGRAIYIDHGAGLVTAYFHLSRADVRRGQTVVAGQRIGAVGRSGRVTGPHLHWVARYGAISVDPMSLLQLEQHRPGVAKRTVPGTAPAPRATSPRSP
ncbi:MAG TPA: M23 family metallopeptidase [Gemmatimonadales bacterium]|nr:M23 family metallopeptidase [Gemmatimonadales bacterium]